MIDCRMEANGVTPIPVPTKTACCALKMCVDGAPKGPSIKIWKIKNVFQQLVNFFLLPLKAFQQENSRLWQFFLLPHYLIHQLHFLSFQFSLKKSGKINIGTNFKYLLNLTNFLLLSCGFKWFKRRSLERNDCRLVSHVSEALSDSAILRAVVCVLEVLKQCHVHCFAVERFRRLGPEVVTQTRKKFS